MKLSEVMVGVSVIAAVEGPPALGELASVALVELAAGASGREEATHGAVLKALMPVILMATGKADVPPRLAGLRVCLVARTVAVDWLAGRSVDSLVTSVLVLAGVCFYFYCFGFRARPAYRPAPERAPPARRSRTQPPTSRPYPRTTRSKDCLKAHDHAIGIVKAIAVALRSASHERIETRVSPPSASGNPALPGEERSENLTPASSPFTGDGSGSSHAAKDGAEDSGDGNQLSAVIAGKGGGVLGATAPVLTMVARLCVSAPDRAEGRVKLAGGIAAVLPELDESDRDRFVEFLAKVCVASGSTFWGLCAQMMGSWLSVVVFGCLCVGSVGRGLVLSFFIGFPGG